MTGENIVTLKLDDFEQRLLVKGMSGFRNELLKEDKPTEDVDDLLIKVIDAPPVKGRKVACREER